MELIVRITTSDLKALRDEINGLSEKCGAQYLGSGLFATTYRHPTSAKSCVKVGMNSGQYRFEEDPSEGDGYLKFIKRAAQERSIFLPRIEKCEIYRNVDPQAGCVYLVTMEELRGNRAYDPFKLAKLIHPSLSVVTDLSHQYRKIKDDPKASEHARALCRVLYNTWRVDGAGKDLHAGNFLVREMPGIGPVPVITDPAV